MKAPLRIYSLFIKDRYMYRNRWTGRVYKIIRNNYTSTDSSAPVPIYLYRKPAHYARTLYLLPDPPSYPTAQIFTLNLFIFPDTAIKL